VYVVGAQGSGKSSLVSALTNERNSAHRSSDAVTFHWIKRANSNGRLDSASVWELPGTEALSQAFVNKTKVNTSHLTFCPPTSERNCGLPRALVVCLGLHGLMLKPDLLAVPCLIHMFRRAYPRTCECSRV
jgi:hypothetical protein